MERWRFGVTMEKEDAEIYFFYVSKSVTATAIESMA